MELKQSASVTTQGLRLLTVPDLMGLLNLSARGVRKMLERGELPSLRLGRRRYVRYEDLERALAKKVEESTQERLGIEARARRSFAGLPSMPRH